MGVASLWSCAQCNVGYEPTWANKTASCNAAGTNTITNCSVNSNDTPQECRTCKSGYVKSNAETSCVAETATTKHCEKLDTAGTACAECKISEYAYFSGTTCIKSSFLPAMTSLLFALMAYML